MQLFSRRGTLLGASTYKDDDLCRKSHAAAGIVMNIEPICQAAASQNAGLMSIVWYIMNLREKVLAVPLTPQRLVSQRRSRMDV